MTSYIPFRYPHEVGMPENSFSRVRQLGPWTDIYYYGEVFIMRAHWLIAWPVFQIYRLFRRRDNRHKMLHFLEGSK